jgi:hypothetical protein
MRVQSVQAPVFRLEVLVVFLAVNFDNSDLAVLCLESWWRGRVY